MALANSLAVLKSSASSISSGAVISNLAWMWFSTFSNARAEACLSLDHAWQKKVFSNTSKLKWNDPSSEWQSIFLKFASRASEFSLLVKVRKMGSEKQKTNLNPECHHLAHQRPKVQLRGKQKRENHKDLHFRKKREQNCGNYPPLTVMFLNLYVVL